MYMLCSNNLITQWLQSVLGYVLISGCCLFIQKMWVTRCVHCSKWLHSLLVVFIITFHVMIVHVHVVFKQSYYSMITVCSRVCFNLRMLFIYSKDVGNQMCPLFQMTSFIIGSFYYYISCNGCTCTCVFKGILLQTSWDIIILITNIMLHH